MTKILVLSLTLTAVLGSVNRLHGGQTNEVYWPQERNMEIGLTADQVNALNLRDREDALRLGECRPDEMDPEGHWGRVVCGMQLSLRSQTNVFTEGDPIPVVAIIRNTGSNDTSVLSVSKGAETAFRVVTESGETQPTYVIGASVYGFKPLAAKRQIKYEYDLASAIKLTQPGVYKIYAIQPAFEFQTNTTRILTQTNVSSGTIKITVVKR